jgi:transcriptional regulator with XRE-family HTH domain
MSQARLAAKVGVVRETIYRLEKGRMATPDVLGRVCDVLDLDRDMFKLDIPETDLFGSHPELTLLRDRRRSLKLTLAECAAAAGVSPATLSRFERGAERSRAIASFDARGRPAHVINHALADILGFRDLAQMDLHWRTGRL